MSEASAPVPAANPAPVPSTAPAAAAPAPKPAAPPAKPVDLAPEGVDCPHCGQRMRVFARYSRSVEYCCPSLKEESPVLADKYAEWRDLYLKSRVTRPL
ncbi:MAG TPA: hypothetical protein VK914_04450 [bacterium]|nr:hypothetical protein [bacterium]